MRENLEIEKQKLKTMNFKQKLEYIAEYYGLQIVIGIFIVGIIVFLCVHFATKKDIVLNVVAVNTVTEDSPANQREYYDSILSKNGIDIKKSDISVNTSLKVSKDANDPLTQKNIELIESRFMANSVDLFLANEEVLYSLAELGFIQNLSVYLPGEVLESHSDSLVYVKDIDSGKKLLAGIHVENSDWLQKTGWYKGCQDVVVGISDNARNMEIAKDIVLEMLK